MGVISPVGFPSPCRGKCGGIPPWQVPEGPTPTLKLSLAYPQGQLSALMMSLRVGNRPLWLLSPMKGEDLTPTRQETEMSLSLFSVTVSHTPPQRVSLSPLRLCSVSSAHWNAFPAPGSSTGSSRLRSPPRLPSPQ